MQVRVKVSFRYGEISFKSSLEGEKVIYEFYCGFSNQSIGGARALVVLTKIRFEASLFEHETSFTQISLKLI